MDRHSKETAPETSENSQLSSVEEVEDKAEVEETGQPQEGQDSSSEERTSEGEEFYVGTYKTKEDAERGLKEAQRKITSLANEKKVLLDTIKELEPYIKQAQSQQTSAPETEEDVATQEAKRLIAEVLEEKLKPLQETTQTLAARTVIADLQAKYPDFTEAIPEIKKIMDENPELQNRIDGLERAYVLYKSNPEHLQKLVQTERETALREGEMGVLQKQKASSEKPSKTPEIDETAELFEKGFGKQPDEAAQIEYFKKLLKSRK